ncbi:MAG TPA: tetratricopeptide repeat protein [Mycobacteriales bacterium]|nr:tetratricopeptide repeat protein [Mycobacteriales bacterium]
MPDSRQRTSDEAQTLDAAWGRLQRHLNRADNFWLGAIFTAHLDAATTLREHAELNCQRRSAPFVFFRPGTSAEFADLLDRIEAEGAPPSGCTWVEALHHSANAAEKKAWDSAWATFLQALNHRRDFLRSTLGGLVLVAPPQVKPVAMRVSTDLWSVLAFLAEVAPIVHADSRRASGELVEQSTSSPASVQPPVVAWEENLPDDVSREVSALMEAADQALLEPPLSARLDARVRWALDEGWPATAAALLVRHAEAAAVLGDYGTAAQDLSRAAALYRRLAEANPAAYQPDLAMSLNNLSIRLGELGRREEGLAAIQEAVEAYRRLAEANPAAYQPDLAASLNNLSNRLGELGRREEGLAAIQEAVAILTPLAAHLPAAFAERLNVVRGTMADILDQLGRADEAEQVRQQAT